MRIIHETENYFVIDKPGGVFVHPPEASRFPVPADRIALYRLRDLLDRDVFPVHRLDAPTSGLVLFANSRAATRELSRLFADREMKKTYQAVARGYLEDTGEITMPLAIKGFSEPINAHTTYRTLARVELQEPVGKKYPTARYSLIEVFPHTGRWHQIRRHFDQISHPLLGDIEHGDSHHNRFFRDNLGIHGLCLRATRLEFIDPWSLQTVKIHAPIHETWQQISKLFTPSNRDAGIANQNQ